MKVKAKAFLRIAAYLLFVVLVVEAAAFVFINQLHEEDFSHEADFWKAYEASNKSFLDYKRSDRYSPITGWQSSRHTRKTKKNCLGEDVTYVNLGDRRRQSLSDIDGQQPRVALFGNSFTQGAEVDTGSTMADYLYTDHGLPTANFGVGGFSPTQAFLYMQEKSKNLESVDVYVLGIMFENIRRNATSFRATYAPTTGLLFGAMPYVRDNKIYRMPEIETEEEFREFVSNAFETDYWAKPKLEFPYTLTAFRLMWSERFRRKVYHNLFGYHRSSYYYDYQDDVALDGLAHTIEQFRQFVRSNGKRGVVFFIPTDGRDIDSPKAFVEREAQKNQDDFKVVLFEDPATDWSKYNLKGFKCHPSPYGQSRLAAYLATVLDGMAPRSGVSQAVPKPN